MNASTQATVEFLRKYDGRVLYILCRQLVTGDSPEIDFDFHAEDPTDAVERIFADRPERLRDLVSQQFRLVLGEGALDSGPDKISDEMLVAPETVLSEFLRLKPQWERLAASH